ncbi:MAG: von Willebrand factor A [Candidatus Peregrinibacteria bacterium Gr01-1014_25]|nr:MAG: von Willebrand factor A [Candidatus Peregrinibacteria bacterium Gr01-1014_25]
MKTVNGPNNVLVIRIWMFLRISDFVVCRFGISSRTFFHHNASVFCRRIIVGLLGIFGLLGLLQPGAAAAASLTWRHAHWLFPVTQQDIALWRADEDVWTLDSLAITPPSSLRVDGDDVPPLPRGITRSLRQTWDRARIERTLRARVLPSVEREPRTVTMSLSSTGTVTFDGVGLPGRKVDVHRAVDLTIAALEANIPDVELPMDDVQPAMHIAEQLRRRGINEVLVVGESIYAGSPVNRRHNIGVGLRRFNGHIIPRDGTFSFNTVLGPVDARTGYRKELTIKGDKTLPDYGGGLCQVSTTVYRGAWEYGLPIVQRRNHSYTVRYYAPAGTDATVYPPHTDVRFMNDSPGDILLQTHYEQDRAYVIYYGTNDGRRTAFAGPFTWGQQPPPPPRTEETTEIPPGETRKVGEAVPGMKALWYRIVSSGTGEIVEPVFSSYEARPLFTQYGVASSAPPLFLSSPASSSSSSRAAAGARRGVRR